MSKTTTQSAQLPRGIIGATLTPFGADNSVDYERLGQLVEIMVTHCDAVSVLGAEVSEYRVMAPAQRRDALRFAVGAVADRVPVVAGASSASVAEVAELSEIAAGAGASFVQVLIPLNPGGTPASESDLVAYFEEVARVSALPVVAYHNPPRGSDPAPATLVKISMIDRVVAFKESSRDITKIGRLIEHIDQAGHARYFTTMQALLPTLAMGGSGAMMPPPATLIGAEVHRSFASGDLVAAARWQGSFRTFPALWAQYGLGPAMKVAMAALGVDLGGPAAPFAPMAEPDRASLRRTVDRLGLPELLAQAMTGTRSAVEV